MTARIKIVSASELTAKRLDAKHYVDLQWGWTLDEYVRGPFKTKEAALKDAKRCGAERIALGHIVYPRPEDCFGLSLSTAIDDASRVAESSAWREEDIQEQFFKIKRENKNEAQKGLDEFMARWARKWVVPTRKIFRFVEEVSIE